MSIFTLLGWLVAALFAGGIIKNKLSAHKAEEREREERFRHYSSLIRTYGPRIVVTIRNRDNRKSPVETIVMDELAEAGFHVITCNNSLLMELRAGGVPENLAIVGTTWEYASFPARLFGKRECCVDFRIISYNGRCYGGHITTHRMLRKLAQEIVIASGIILVRAGQIQEGGPR